ncbi:MAG: ASKHA domain-containing protein [Anaerolineales bacterium]
MTDPKNEPLTYTIDFEPIGRRVDIASGGSLLEAAHSAGVELVSICGGKGSCDGCQVRVMSGKLSSPTLEEKSFFTPFELEDGYRLACQAKPQTDVKIDVPPESLATTQRLQVEGQGVRVEGKGIITPIDLVLEPASLTDLRSDTARLRDALQIEGHANVSFSPDLLFNLSDFLREQNWRVRAALRGDRVVALLPEDVRMLGLAVDVGTTKVAAYLLDLESGDVRAVRGAMNPQVSYGEDVISRINYCNENEGGRRALRDKVVATLNGMIAEMCGEAGVSPEQIVEAVIVGNTAMHHLLAGLPVRQLAMAPYVPAVSEALDLPAGEIELDISPGAFIHLPPNTAGFIGADHISMVLSTDLWKAEGTVIALDIGTNTEITLAVDGRMLSCSCASGPAFEGAHIRDGMRAAPGAIERVQIKNGQPNIYTIGEKPPVGICGSGILDAVAELLKGGVIDHRGSFQEGAPNVNVREGMSTQHREFLLVPAEDTGHGKDIVVTRSDINEIQLAKGAIRAGLEILLEEGGIEAGDIDEFIIAGAFGTYLDVGSAMTVGMFPELPRERFRQVGNAAGTGAQQMLVSGDRRRVADEIPERIEYIELTTHAGFEKTFMKALFFNP